MYVKRLTEPQSKQHIINTSNKKPICIQQKKSNQSSHNLFSYESCMTVHQIE